MHVKGKNGRSAMEICRIKVLDMSAESAAETMKTIVSWVRHAELFAYDEQDEMFSLEHPE
jgi:hypothetical protein